VTKTQYTCEGQNAYRIPWHTDTPRSGKFGASRNWVRIWLATWVYTWEYTWNPKPKCCSQTTGFQVGNDCLINRLEDGRSVLGEKHGFHIGWKSSECAGWPVASLTICETLNEMVFSRQNCSTSGIKQFNDHFQMGLFWGKSWNLIANKLAIQMVKQSL